MNITDFWPDDELFQNTASLWDTFLNMRIATYRGFTEIEKEKGFLQPTASLNSAAGQEMARILLFRVIEELGESYLSEDVAHIREEAVDAMNYLLAIYALDPVTLPVSVLSNILQEAADVPTPPIGHWAVSLTKEKIGDLAIMMGGQLGDTFRNRSWMNNAQDTYFSGQRVLLSVIYEVTRACVCTCTNFDEFARMYIAKDRVLQFRLRSNY